MATGAHAQNNLILLSLTDMLDKTKRQNFEILRGFERFSVSPNLINLHKAKWQTIDIFSKE